jgi:hypothetical protein
MLKYFSKLLFEVPQRLYENTRNSQKRRNLRFGAPNFPLADIIDDRSSRETREEFTPNLFPFREEYTGLGTKKLVI